MPLICFQFYYFILSSFYLPDKYKSYMVLDASSTGL
jgi:hypothetical protein